MTFVEEIDVDSGIARIGLLLFSDNIRLAFNLNEYSSRLDIIEHVQRIPYTRGSTNTAAALQYVTDTMFTSGNGDRNNARNVAFLITDGQSNNREDTMREAKQLKDKGIHLFVAGVGESFSLSFLLNQNLTTQFMYKISPNVTKCCSAQIID